VSDGLWVSGRPGVRSGRTVVPAGVSRRYRLLVIIRRRRVDPIVTTLALIGAAAAGPFVPGTAASWLGLAALALLLWPLCVDPASPATIAVGHLGLIVSCFATGVHDHHRIVWLTLLATFAALPSAWAFRRRGRTVRAIAGLVLAAVTFGVYAWSVEHLDRGQLSVLPQELLVGTVAGIVMIVQALRRPKPPPPPPPTVSAPPPAPARAPWARDVTEPVRRGRSGTDVGSR
jgi:hypothetical protein